MNSKDVLTINVNLDWRVLVILGIIGGMLIFSYSVVGAQGGDPPNINEVEVEPTVDVSESTPVTVPEAPQAQAGDLVFTTNDEWVPRSTLGSAPSPSTGAEEISPQAASGSRFYLTDASHPTDGALTACASGYHMASLWEILDVSNLSYAYDHPDAHVKADSGNGPPSGWNGWVRTGRFASTGSSAGTGNCNNWTSTSSGDSAASVKLTTNWETPPDDISTWNATSFTCNFVGPVWCVED
jgi:hypothetical protein